MTGEIAQLGASYAIALEAVDCASGDTLVRELAEAPAKEQVLQAVGRATTALRERLGESLASIRKLDTPIEQATTSSLEALRALTQADALRAQGKRLEALAVFKRAIALDPDFALAHARLGVLYQNLSENTLASAHRTRAFELRARGSERERFYIEASYYGSTALDQASARETFDQWSQTYPRDATPVHNLGTIEDSEGRYERALDYFRASVQIDPSVELMHLNVISKATQLDRLEEASAALKVAVPGLAKRRRCKPSRISGHRTRRSGGRGTARGRCRRRGAARRRDCKVRRGARQTLRRAHSHGPAGRGARAAALVRRGGPLPFRAGDVRRAHGLRRLR